MRALLSLGVALGLVGLGCSEQGPAALPESTARATVTLPAIARSSAPLNETQGEYRATSHHRFDDVEHWKTVLDDPKRPEWQQPKALLRDVGVVAGMRVADLGAGTGFFLPFLSGAVGPSGRVLALEVEPELVRYLQARVEREHLGNVEVRLIAPDSVELGPASIDLLLIVDTYHHIDHRLAYLEGVVSTLTRRGRVVIVDWKSGLQPVGPREESHKVPVEQVAREMRAAGYSQLGTSADLPYQYVLVFTPAVATPRAGGSAP